MYTIIVRGGMYLYQIHRDVFKILVPQDLIKLSPPHSILRKKKNLSIKVFK